MAIPRYLGIGASMRNPGNGSFSVWSVDPVIPRFSTITVAQTDPALTISGVLSFSLGAYSATIDLGAGARFLALTGPVPTVFMDITGANIAEEWRLILS